mgnify:CR=1 FL=1
MDIPSVNAIRHYFNVHLMQHLSHLNRRGDVEEERSRRIQEIGV